MKKFGFIPLKRLVFFALCAVVAAPLCGQNTLKLNKEKSSIVVEGGSTLKDWKATASAINGECTVSYDSTFAINSAQVMVEGKSLDGGRGPDMNAKICKALAVDSHPHVKFVTNEADIIENNGGQIKVRTSGSLEIAGKALPATIDLTGSAEPLDLMGTYAITFSQYDIKPPSALFGQIVCDDEMSIQIRLVFE